MKSQQNRNEFVTRPDSHQITDDCSLRLFSIDPIRGQLDRERRERERLVKHNVEMESLKYLRSSFKHQVENGALRRPQIHVEFSHPKGCEEFCCCVTTGRLRLTNISAVF